jgi:hypothetical protein
MYCWRFVCSLCGRDRQPVLQWDFPGCLYIFCRYSSNLQISCNDWGNGRLRCVGVHAYVLACNLSSKIVECYRCPKETN